MIDIEELWNKYREEKLKELNNCEELEANRIFFYAGCLSALAIDPSEEVSDAVALINTFKAGESSTFRSVRDKLKDILKDQSKGK